MPTTRYMTKLAAGLCKNNNKKPYLNSSNNCQCSERTQMSALMKQMFYYPWLTFFSHHFNIHKVQYYVNFNERIVDNEIMHIPAHLKLNKWIMLCVCVCVACAFYLQSISPNEQIEFSILTFKNTETMACHCDMAG